jgi:RNA recognition motif-containing protein
MGSKLYVGNLSYGMTEDSLAQVFAECGNVVSARIITDRETGRSKGFGFVEMGSDDEAQKAVSALNGKQIDGRPITVNEARPQEPRGQGGDRRGGGGGGYGGGGGGRGRGPRY